MHAAHRQLNNTAVRGWTTKQELAALRSEAACPPSHILLTHKLTIKFTSTSEMRSGLFHYIFNAPSIVVHEK